MTYDYLFPCNKRNPWLRQYADRHYSAPKSFVGRSICYLICDIDECYGAIAGGSATRWLVGRDKIVSDDIPLENIVNNIFFHIEPPYPERNFAKKILAQFRKQIEIDWLEKYGDKVLAFETLVELPRTGEVYKRDKWLEVGETKGFTCKREGGQGTDSWTGKRVWNTTELRPKRVFVRLP